MSHNYFAPTFQIEINGVGLSADVSKYIQQLSVISERNRLDSFSLTLVNPYPKMRWTDPEEDARLFSIGNAVSIQWGYVGDQLQTFSGEITQLSAQFPNSGAPTLTVEGKSRLHRLTRRRHSQDFQGQTYKQIVEQIATVYGLTPQVEDAEETALKRTEVRQNNSTDLEFLLEQARLIHFEIQVEDKTLILRRVEKDESPAIVLEWGKNLQSFTPTMNARGQVNQVTVRGYDPKAKKEIVGRFKAPGADGQSGAKITQQAFGEGEEVRVDHPIWSQEEANQLAQAKYYELARRFMTGNGATIGLPNLKAGSVVKLAGLGMFNGKYHLTQVTHALGTGGYTTRFAGERLEQ
jgi:uncharacterized protein